VLKLKFADISTLCEKLVRGYQDQAMVVRSVTSCYETLLKTVDNATWNKEDQCKSILEDLLSLTLDHRPKVRKRAVDAVRNILISPPPPAFCHPGTVFTIDFCLMIFENYGHGKLSKDKDSQLMDLLGLLNALIPVFCIQSKNTKVGAKIGELVEYLLNLPVRSSAGNTILIQWVFTVLKTLLTTNQEQKLDFKVVLSIVSALIKLSPYENDAILTPAWLDTVACAFSKLAEYIMDFEIGRSDSVEDVEAFIVSDYSELVTSIYKKIFKTYFENGSNLKQSILEKATSLMSTLLEKAVSNQMISEIAGRQTSNLMEMISLLELSLKNIHLRENWGNLLIVSASAFNRLGSNTPELTIPLLRVLFELRDDNAFSASFPFKVEIELALFSAIQNLGIEKFLTEISLNIENEMPNEPKRAYLLSIIAASFGKPFIAPCWEPLTVLGPHGFNFFATNLLPLAERMLQKSGELWLDGRQLESKVFETIGLQIWGLFPLIAASFPNDIPKAFGYLAPYLGNALTTDPEVLHPSLPSKSDLRPLVCQGLESLIDTFLELISFQVDNSDDSIRLQYKNNCRKAGELGLETLKRYANRFLSALCNIYTCVDISKLNSVKSTGQTLQVLHEKSIQYYEKPIKKFLLVADPSAIEDYSKVLVSSIYQKYAAAESSDGERLSIYAMIDLVLILIPHLRNHSLELLPVKMIYEFCLDRLETEDKTLQKKIYKGLCCIFDLGVIDDVSLNVLANKLTSDSAIALTSSGASKSRVRLVQKIILKMENKDALLKFIPQFLPEVMLATKEASEKTREVGYECLVSMARKMMEGVESSSTLASSLNSMGLDKTAQESNDKSGAMDYSGEVSIREFFLMVLAGLGGASSHMQSASIASLGRLVFEFSGKPFFLL
jgi:ribosomal RNA-processing protein 12